MHTGVEGLIWIVIWAYIALAIGSLVFAFRVRGDTVAKPAALAVVAVIWGAPLLVELGDQIDKARRNKFKTLVSKSCASQQLTPLTIEARELYVSNSALMNVVKLESASHFMLDHGLSRLELDATFNVLGKLDTLSDYDALAHPQATVVDRILALSLLPKDDNRCSAFNRWVSKYPAQSLPALRWRGLRPDTCIGISVLETQTSQFSISAIKHSLHPESEHEAAIDEYTFSARDGNTGFIVASSKATLWTGKDGKKGDSCVTDDERRRELHRSNLVTLDRIVPARRPLAPSIDTDDEPPDFPLQREASQRDIESSLSMHGVNRVWSTNIIDADATTWIETKYVTTNASGSFLLHGYYLVSLRDAKLHRTFIRLGSMRVFNVTGLLVTQDEIRLIGMDSNRKARWLLIYTRDAKPKMALALDDKQFLQFGDQARK